MRVAAAAANAEIMINAEINIMALNCPAKKIL